MDDDDADKSGGDSVRLGLSLDEHDYDIRSETAVSGDGDDRDIKDIKPVIKMEADDVHVKLEVDDVHVKLEVDDAMSTDFPGTQHPLALVYCNAWFPPFRCRSAVAISPFCCAAIVTLRCIVAVLPFCSCRCSCAREQNCWKRLSVFVGAK